MPIAVDAVGDQVLQTAVPWRSAQPAAVPARAFGSPTVEPSPIAGPAWWTAAGSSTGRALIAATTVVGRLRVATWTR